MWLALCPEADLAAIWACQGLGARGMQPIELIGAQQLACSLHWEHYVGHDGVKTVFRLADGRQVASEDVDGVLNRLTMVPTNHLTLANAADLQYANQELYAFFLSWLYGLPCPVLNRPTPQGLCGAYRHPSEWAWLAASAGLSIAPYAQSDQDILDTMTGPKPLFPFGTPTQTVFVVDGYVVGASAPNGIRQSCQTLAEKAQTALLGIDFAHSAAGAWTFAGASPVPDLRLGGGVLLDALARAMRAKGEAA